MKTRDEDKDTTDHNQQQALEDSKGDPNIDEDEEDRLVSILQFFDIHILNFIFKLPCLHFC